MAAEYRAGLANALMLFAAALVLTSIIVIAFNQPLTELLAETSDQCQTAACTTGQGWVSDMWTYYPFFATFLAILSFYRAATTESRRPF